MKILAIAAALCAAALACGCTPAASPAKPNVDTAKIVDAIKTDEVHWNNDWKSGDPAKIAGHYAPAATVMIPGLAPMVGAQAMRAGIAESLEDKGFALTFASDKVDVAASGDLAAARGTYTQTTTDPKTQAFVTEKGAYVTVYKPQPGGAWKAVWDINAPGAPPAAAAAK
ncbi:MAG: DUF4440 domain-containing protein [Caulobacteraceae bacterium]